MNITSVVTLGAGLACLATAYELVRRGVLLSRLFAYLRNLLLAFYLFHVKKKTELLTFFDFFDNFEPSQGYEKYEFEYK